MMLCPNCRTESPADNKFCGNCGAALVAAPSPVAVPGEDGAFFCAKHAKAVTRLRCGRCEAPICTKCTVYTPAGTRCKACARNRVAVRPRAVLHGAGRVVENSARTVGARPWYLLIFYWIISLLRGGFGE